MTTSSSPPSSSDWNVAELKMKALLPPSVASDPGLSAEIRKIGGDNYFVFPSALGCRCCAAKPECLIRVKGYLKLLEWCTGDTSEIRRPYQSACAFCSKGRKPFCRFKCIDTILGPKWFPKTDGYKRTIHGNGTKAPAKKGGRKRKNADTILAAASSSKDPRTPVKPVRSIHQAAIGPPSNISQTTSPSITSSPSLALIYESNDLFRMIINKCDLNHLIPDEIDAQKDLGL